MLTRRQNLPSALHSSENIAVLLVSLHGEDEAVLREMLPSTYPMASLSRCDGLEQAMPQIRETQPAVVICERDLPGGSWKAVLGTCEALARPPVVLVVSRHADENLWAEVLNLGGYDVLLKPFERSEVSRVIASACRQWCGSTPRLPVASVVTAPPSLTAQFA
ncbi:MAG TPA: response regulator [Bryobacteraceae bacterium]|nr:response regulator [Bryobacteraceae bacterium]